MARLRAVADEAAAAALERLGGEEGATVEHWLTLRYHGQARQLTLRVGDLGDLPVDERFPAVVARFESEHAARFGPGPASAEAGLEVLRVLAVASGIRPPLPAATGKRLDRARRRKVVFDDPGRPVETPVFTGPELIAPAQLVEGPCVLELPGCAVVVPPGSRARTDAAGNVHVKVRTAGRALAPAPAKPVHRTGRRLLGKRAVR
jgi:N-methylhydantoinase A